MVCVGLSWWCRFVCYICGGTNIHYMVDRIRLLMEHLGQTSSQFADSMEIPRAVLSHIMSGRNKPSLDVIIRLLAKQKEVNPNWLLHGEGEMLNSLAPKVAPETIVADPSKEIQNGPEVISGPVQETGKVQNQPEAEMPLPLPVNDTKKVKQVILVYTDNSFAILHPEQ